MIAFVLPLPLRERVGGGPSLWAGRPEWAVALEAGAGRPR